MRAFLFVKESEEEELRFKLLNEIFLCAFKKTSAEKNCAVKVSGNLGDADLSSMFSKVSEKLGPIRGLAFKLIGPSNALPQLEVAIVKNGGVVEKRVEREKEFEVIFEPKSGRLRVEAAKSPSSVPAQVAGVKKTTVLIVDDSPSIRKVLNRVFASDESIVVIGEAGSPREALELLKTCRPDVMTLDIHMPEMSGIEFLRKYYNVYKIPTVLITSLRKEDSGEVLEGLSLGAIDYIQKPELSGLGKVAPEICERVRSAATSKAGVHSVHAVANDRISFPMDCMAGQILAIGSSTGGTEALRFFFDFFSDNIPPTVVVQHIPPVFSKAFADRLNELYSFEVKEAEDGDEIKANRVLIAPGGKQMRVKKRPGRWTVHLFDEGPVNRHCPAVDVLFDSVAEQFSKDSVGVILTGMGADGAKGLLQMKNAGSRTIAQSEQTCVVYGMPRVAVELGAAESICDLGKIPGKIVDLMRRHK